MEKLYTVQEAADYLRIERRTVYALIKRRQLHAVKVGKFLRIPADSIIELTCTPSAD